MRVTPAGVTLVVVGEPTLRSMRRHQRSAREHRSSARRHRRSRGVSSDIGDCGVGITPQICNRVTNHEDMDDFSNPEFNHWKNFDLYIFDQFFIIRHITNAKLRKF